MTSEVDENPDAQTTPLPDPPPPGHGEGKPWYKTVRAGVFWPSLAVILAFVPLAMFGGETVGSAIDAIKNGVVSALGWYYIVLVSGFVAFAIWMGASHYGDIVLGRSDEKAEFSMPSWLAMLFAAGMGIGLVFWGVSEPLHHFAGIPNRATGISDQLDTGAAQDSIVQSFLHWGLHPWAIYVVVGLAIAYAVHVRNRPVSIRWSLESLLGRRTDGWIGNVIDVIAIVGTVFGVATSLGLGVAQIAGGMQFLGIISEPSNMVMVLLIGGITMAAIWSVVSGVKRGIKILSNVNMGMAIALLAFVLIAGPTLFLLREYVEAMGLYLQSLLQLSFNVTAYSGAEGVAWQGWWTAFYWGWWMSWAPFVGVFIARISRGRTVREFVMGVLLVPTVFSFLWFTVLGGTALQQQLTREGGPVGAEGSDSLITSVADGSLAVDTNTALFQMLQNLGPAGTPVAIGSILLIALFFVTSSDSGSLVVDMLASGGDPEPPTWSRILWSVIEGLVAIALVLAGGLAALQGVAITIALPFSVIMIFMCVALIRQFRAERAKMLRAQRRLAREEMTEHVSEEIVKKGLLERIAGRRAPTGAGGRSTVAPATAVDAPAPQD